MMDLKEEQAIGGDPATHWYYIAKGRAIRSLLGEERHASMLDVGAGSGVFSEILTRAGVAETSLCVDPNYTDEFLAEDGDGPIDYMRSVTETDASLVLMIDVIEHVDDDVALLADYVRMAPEGAKFLVSVPAFSFLWSSHDDFLEHRRRYTIESLERAIEAAGLKPLRSRYFFGMLFPAVAAMRLADRAISSKNAREPAASALKPAPEWLSKALIAVHDLERATLFPVNKLAGVTAFCLAEKPRHLANAADAA
jgi:SAM-dependent methyltransferase